MREQAVGFGPRQALIGIVTWPSPVDSTLAGPATPIPPKTPDGLPAVVLLNAGILHRVGPNRTSVKIARSLAAIGFVVLRFDLSGIGDSLPRHDDLPFDQAALLEVQQAMTMLHALAGSTQFLLMGLCSGAHLSLRAALNDRRVIGAVLLNAREHLHDDQDEKLTMALRNRALLHHYQRLALHSSFRTKNWRKTLTGNLNLPLLREAILGFRLRNPFRRQQAELTTREYALAQLQTLSARGVRLLHIYCEGDEGLDYFRLVLGADADAQPMTLIRGANHTFSTLWSQERLIHLIRDWAQYYIPAALGDERAA